MSYVDVNYDRKFDRMRVAERINGQRVLSEVPVEHVFYYTHPAGSHRTIFDQPCKKFSTFSSRKSTQKKAELLKLPKPPTIVESDIRLEFRHLAKHYSGVNAPVLNLGFFDIEADWNPDYGWSSADEAKNAVTAISIYLSSDQTLYTMALCPPTLEPHVAQEMCDPVRDDEGNVTQGFENTMVFDKEIDMLRRFLDLIEDVDVLSGWNSEGYDVPYLVNRVKLLMGDNAARRFCLWGMLPRERKYLKFGKESKTYDFIGRVHLDYLVLYQKHNPQQQQSYRLDYIGEQEVGENKTPYEGTLDDLYKKDFYRFIEYNRQDVALLVKIDAKRKFIELANQIAHTNCVLLRTTVGSVSLVEAAIINEMHALGYVVPDRKPKEDEETEATPRTKQSRTVRTEYVDSDILEHHLHTILTEMSDEEREIIFADMVARGAEETDLHDPESSLREFASYLEATQPAAMDRLVRQSTYYEDVEVVDEDDDAFVKMSKDGRTPVVGAYVAQPKKGIHREIACIDINSLYPSCIRALNMSPETIFGQVRPTATMALVEKRIEGKTPRAEAWDGIFCLLEVTAMHNRTDEIVTVDFEDGTSKEMSGAELNDLIFTPSNYLCISANGTIFRTDKEGIIPQLLAKWYSERQTMQGLKELYGDMADGVTVDEELLRLLS